MGGEGLGLGLGLGLVLRLRLGLGLGLGLQAHMSHEIRTPLNGVSVLTGGGHLVSDMIF